MMLIMTTYSQLTAVKHCYIITGLIVLNFVASGFVGSVWLECVRSPAVCSMKLEFIITLASCPSRHTRSLSVAHSVAFLLYQQ